MSSQRIAYIDQIKVFLTCLVVAHHAAQAYGPTGGVWVVSDAAKADWLGSFFFLNASYMMGLYFFISGYFLVFSVARKPLGQFSRDRFVRLGIPLAVFTLLVFLPFNYLGSGASGPVLPFFLDLYFNKPPLATGHLWFVASLLVYSFIFIFLFRGWFSRLAPSAPPLRMSWVWMYVAVLSVTSALVRLHYPIDTWRTWLIPIEVAHLPQYLSLFLLGTLFNYCNWLDQLRLRQGVLFAGVAVATFIGQYWLPPAVQSYWLTESVVESLLCVGISMGLLTFFRHFANHSGPITRVLSENAYGIYLFHLLLVILLQQLILAWPLGPNLKFVLVTVGGILAALAMSALLRRSALVRRVI